MTDPQYESYDSWARAWAAFSAGRFDETHREGLRAAERASFFHPLAVPLAARAALWARDATGARAALDRLNATMYRGAALALDKQSIEAGIAALEGRTAEALALYREALRGWRTLGCAWDEALAAVDMARLLGPGEPDVKAAADWARETLTRLGAQPFLDRLDAALASKEPGAKPTTTREHESVNESSPV